MIKTYDMKFFKATTYTEEKIVYGFFSRNGGYSKEPYKSLNCSYNAGDIKDLVDKNIFSAQKQLGLNNSYIKFIKQVHSNDINIIDHKNIFKETIADGSITIIKDICLAILTADCVPIFLYDRNNHLICAIHSGWRGCLKNIVSVAMKKISSITNNSNDISAIIGPCLGKNNFKVDEKFKKKFLEKEIEYNNFFVQNDHYPKTIYFDMRGLIDFQLQNTSINQIHHVNKDTYAEKNLFFSHRRAIHTDSLPTGRMVNIIGFRQLIG